MTVYISSNTKGCFLPDKQEELVIFCVGQELRRVAALRAWAAHRRLDVRSLIGSYNGLTEMSFVVLAADYADVARWTRAEESVLFLGVDQDGARHARLIFTDGRVEDLGHFVTCLRDTVFASPSWTYDPATDEYYICVQEISGEQAVLPVSPAQRSPLHNPEVAG